MKTPTGFYIDDRAVMEPPYAKAAIAQTIRQWLARHTA